MLNIFYLLHFLECGSFCINYILKKEKLKKRVTYNKMMMSLGLIKRVLLNYFNKVECYKNYPLELIDFRCIALMRLKNGNYHYIVINKLENSYVYYYDPLFVLTKKVRINKFKLTYSKIICKYE